MIKRYRPYIEYSGCHCCPDEVSLVEETDGYLVKHDDIKHLIPDNRVRPQDFNKWLEKNWVFTGKGSKSKCCIKLDDLYIYVVKQGWIKSEVGI